MQEFLFPSEAALPFGVEEARIAAKLYRQVRKARDREIDIAIAACAITHEAALWTLNQADFKDIPGLTLAHP
jgi:predicted nucleic acid-binding protein